MKALVCREPHELILEDTPTHVTPEGWIPIDVARVGICGTDYHIYGGNQPFLQYPRIMGHEVSGFVCTDQDSAGFKAGELVIANPYLSCGTCHACKLSKPNCCEQINVIGVHRDGAMTTRISLPPQNLIRADGLSADQAAMVEFLAIGRHAVARTRIYKGAKTLVVGAGPIGLATALFARIDGGDVSIADVSSNKLAMVAERFGFATVNIAKVASGDLSLGFTHVFDATGNIRAMNAGLDYLAHGGTYTLVSVVKDDLIFSDPEFHKREATLIASRNALSEDFEFVIGAIRAGQIETERLKTHDTTLEGAVTHLPQWASDRDSVIKAIIEVT